ncbi:hypothetical protein FB45DRAFT_914564 [Roridomyces roridus]|uniref:TRP C-terminal domain-containing protein n=1 Tax=Roridomyces roridus TaxID=1738132 RepID=A0AAD7FRF3_9AGAR|nr:hypothetical protein FB45DRAFT_914564 [Roridomyces roridus]
MSSVSRLPATMGAAVVALLLAVPVFADPATIPFSDCFTGNDSMKLSIDDVYAQVLSSSNMGTYLNLTIVGNSPQEINGSSDASLSLATLFTTTTVLTLSAWSNSSELCHTMRPPSPLSPLASNDTNYCPLAPGPFALSTSIPWGPNRPLTTLNTRLRAVDPFSHELLCFSVSTTPLDPRPNNPYGLAHSIFWATVVLAILYWVVVGIARIVSAWGRGITRPGRSLWSRAQSAGFILASAISGERFATSPALMRFSTPCLRDVLFHTQWCAALAMVAVQWPPFVYPLLAQTAWATLSYNITLTDNPHWNPLSTLPFNPSSQFSDQMADPTSPLYIDPTVPNVLFTLPSNATSGMAMFAYTVGVRPKDLFMICIILFLGIVAATVVLSVVVWSIDLLGSVITGAGTPLGRRARSPGPKELDGTPEQSSKAAIFRPSSRLTLSNGGITATPRKPWYRIRTEISSFHWSVLHGNLVRILVLFHLPLTIFAVYEMTQSASVASVTARALAALSFAVLSILLPGLLVLRVTLTTTNKLYDETRTLLALGPLYNHYRHGSQLFACLLFVTNLVFGIVIGAGQKSGTAQAVVILVVEIGAALVTSIWLPWGSGASMGLISFLFCVARIVIAVLLVILTPAISIGDGSGSWVAYGVLVILALVYLALALMLIIKLIEAAVRIIGQVGFDRSHHSVDSGLLGAFGLLGCCGSRKRRSPRHRHRGRGGGYVSPNATHVSDGSSTFAPPPPLGSQDSKKGSIHSQQPPSVLRPEHALRPYREESDDESGYIMGAWQPFPRPGGYNQMSEPPSPVTRTAPPPASGFSRVGGGRAHIDAPYAAIAQAGESTRTLEWPAMDAARREDDAPSVSSVPRRQSPETVVQPEAQAPPRGALLPHMRTKSQTAIIENAPILGSSRPPSRGNGKGRRQTEDDDDDDDAASDNTGHRRKKPWYVLRRHRPHSDGTAAAPPSSFPTPSNAQAAAAATSDVPAGRSFVVIRKPQASPGRPQQLSTASSPTPPRGSLIGGNEDNRASSATS